MTRNEFISHVEREQDSLRSFLLTLCCGDRNESDASYKDSGHFRSWLFKIAYNTFLNHKASARTTGTLDDAHTLISSNTTDNRFEHQDLYLALRILPPKERSAITLYYLNGYDIKEIATITDTSEDAVKKQLSRGRHKLKVRLKP